MVYHLVSGSGTSESPRQLEPLALSAPDAARLCGVSRSQWWKLHSAGKIPLPVRLGTRAPRWRVDELREWLAAGCPDRAAWERTRRRQP
ncbi:MAG: AlpA family phage regulatory protein [Planctomycetes bacterium]|nr:AlpA family phage regulatory protein [Planctomycetota bacterium]